MQAAAGGAAALDATLPFLDAPLPFLLRRLELLGCGVHVTAAMYAGVVAMAAVGVAGDWAHRAGRLYAALDLGGGAR